MKEKNKTAVRKLLFVCVSILSFDEKKFRFVKHPLQVFIQVSILQPYLYNIYCIANVYISLAAVKRKNAHFNPRENHLYVYRVLTVPAGVTNLFYCR